MKSSSDVNAFHFLFEEPLCTTMTALLDLPNELLIGILLDCDELQPLVESCRRFRTLTQAHAFRVQWFWRRHGKHYSIFYALCYPRVASIVLLEGLQESGAILSRSLVQEVELRNTSEPSSPQARQSKWATALTEGCSTG